LTMATYRTVHLSFWTDTKVSDTFSPEDKYTFIYLLTNPHTNIVGCYEISRKQISRDLGYTVDAVAAILDRLIRVHRVIEYDEDTQEVFVRNWCKYNWTTSEKFRKAAEDVAKKIKSDKFRDEVTDLLLYHHLHNL